MFCHPVAGKCEYGGLPWILCVLAADPGGTPSCAHALFFSMVLPGGLASQVCLDGWGPAALGGLQLSSTKKDSNEKWL